MKTAEIRRAFIEYFKQQGHTEVASSALVPENDPTLLFTNAGMVQFKDVFLGKVKSGYTRAVTAQKCVRAGGKHNDLENVGYTARHHTFFEMLGNFSFGDYFKREAIEFAWAFVTEVLKLPPEKLWVTTHISDDEAKAIWFDNIGIDPSRFSQLDEDNFWSAGDTGPCGPCSEIFYDHGPDVWGGPPGSAEEDGDRYIEIWNLVFMQYNRNADGTQTDLPNPSVDTGMGLERVTAIMQSVHSNYEIDTFQALIKQAAKILAVDDLSLPSLRVVADHIRSCSFLILDGVVPSNEGRGYVLRRIIRRAARHGHKLGGSGPFFFALVDTLAEVMGDAYPALVEHSDAIKRVLKQEEEQFLRTLALGMKELNEALSSLEAGAQLPGDVAFKLYDTFGFPLDLTADVLRERGFSVDQAGFERCMQEQRDRARGASQFGVGETGFHLVNGVTDFTGYQQLALETTISQLLRAGKSVSRMTDGEEGFLVTSTTPFYAEAGGQVGDRGQVLVAGQRGELEVIDTTKTGDAFVHHIEVTKGVVSVGDRATFKVDAVSRLATARHHSATHLMHAALRLVLGAHVTQKGSLVDDHRLRFDFAHTEPVRREQLIAVEDIVNQQILANVPVSTAVMTPEAAKAKGAMALFGEKYGDSVRVLSMGVDDFSVELCGGTHVSRTGDIGLFKILVETGVAAGVRRIEAVAGEVALAVARDQHAALERIACALKSDRSQVIARLEQLISTQKEAEKTIRELKQKLASGGAGDVLAGVQKIGSVQVLAEVVDVDDVQVLRSMIDSARDKLGSAIVFFAAVGVERTSLVCGVTKDLTKRYPAGEVVKHVAGMINGRGGGRPDMAQGGGPVVKPDALEDALAAIGDWVAAQTEATAS